MNEVGLVESLYLILCLTSYRHQSLKHCSIQSKRKFVKNENLSNPKNCDLWEPSYPYWPVLGTLEFVDGHDKIPAVESSFLISLQMYILPVSEVFHF